MFGFNNFKYKVGALVAFSDFRVGTVQARKREDFVAFFEYAYVQNRYLIHFLNGKDEYSWVEERSIMRAIKNRAEEDFFRETYATLSKLNKVSDSIEECNIILSIGFDNVARDVRTLSARIEKLENERKVSE